MTQASGSRVAIGYILETALGTTPATPELKAIPFQSITGSPTADKITDPSIRSDRMRRYTRNGNIQVPKAIDVTMSYGTFDDFLETAMLSTWQSDVLKIGTGVTGHVGMTIEQAFTDIGVYFQYRGMVPKSFKLMVPPNGPVKATFSMIGMSASNTATIDTTAGYTAPTSYIPFVHLDGTFEIDGTPVGYISGIEFTLENGYDPLYGLGSGTAYDVTYKMATITGNMTTTFFDSSMYLKALNEQSVALNFILSDGTNTQTYHMGNVHIDNVEVPVSNDGPVTQTINFEALYDTTDASLLKITRS